MSWITRNFAKQYINHYTRETPAHHVKGYYSASDRRTLVIVPISVAIDDSVGSGRTDLFITTLDTELDLNTASNWDATIPIDYTIAANRAGKDLYVYACAQAGNTPKLLLSANSTYPSGYTATNSRKIGGFHCLPHVTAPTWLANTVTKINYVVQPVTLGANKLLYRCISRTGDYKTGAAEPTWPTTLGETVVDDAVTWICEANGCKGLIDGSDPYYGFLMGDILFNSIWDLLDRPLHPEGTVKLSLTPSDGKSAKWCDIYLASGNGTVLSSVSGNAVKSNTSQKNFSRNGAKQGKRLLYDYEFLDAADGQPGVNHIAGTYSVYAIFPLDTDGRSMISKYGLVGATGNYSQWLQNDMYEFAPTGGRLAAGLYQTIGKNYVYYVAEPGGNPVYLKISPDGRPYLCSNLAVGSADVVISFTGSPIIIKHDASANTGLPVYIDDDAARPDFVVCNNTIVGQTIEIESLINIFSLPIIHNANAATVGTALYYNETTSHLESALAHGANVYIELGMPSSSVQYYAPPTVETQQNASPMHKALGGGLATTYGGPGVIRYTSSVTASYAQYGARFIQEALL